jgi:hypothetical protein
METESALGERITEAGMALDELVSTYGIRVVLAGLAAACEVRGDMAGDEWQGPEGLFDPVWERLASKLDRLAKSRDLPQDGGP